MLHAIVVCLSLFIDILMLKLRLCFVYAIFLLSLASLVGFSFAAHGGFPKGRLCNGVGRWNSEAR